MLSDYSIQLHKTELLIDNVKNVKDYMKWLDLIRVLIFEMKDNYIKMFK